MPNGVLSELTHSLKTCYILIFSIGYRHKPRGRAYNTSPTNNEKISGSDISGAWVKKRFCYGESVELITAKGLCADVVEILWNARILFDALQAWDSAPGEWVQALADWVLAVFVNSSTFGVLDLESLDTDLADLLDSVY